MELQRNTIETYMRQWTGRTVTVEALQQLGAESTGAAALKAFGYGQPLLIDYRDNGERRRVVLRQVKRNGFTRPIRRTSGIGSTAS
jgi:hypothetical protein